MLDSEIQKVFVQVAREYHENAHKQHVLCSSRTSTLYVISNGQGYFKIGVTSKNVFERVAELQTGSPYKLLVAYEFLVDSNYALAYESYIHQRFDGGRAEGEWFKLSPSDFDWFNQAVLPVIFAPILIRDYAMPDEYFPEGCKDSVSPVGGLGLAEVKKRQSS